MQQVLRKGGCINRSDFLYRINLIFGGHMKIPGVSKAGDVSREVLTSAEEVKGFKVPSVPQEGGKKIQASRHKTSEASRTASAAHQIFTSRRR